MIDITLIGHGAIAQALLQRLAGHASLRVRYVVVRPTRVVATQLALDALVASLGPSQASPQANKTNGAGHVAQAVSAVPPDAGLVLECAAHAALLEHVLPALARGVECAVLSVGALAAPGLPEQLEAAALAGGTQVHLLAGAIGGIDAIAAARLAGLSELTYTGRKPPSAWALGGTAEEKTPTRRMDTANVTIILEASAREAARLYPKNANVAATVALAGLGLDATRVRLLADPTVSENVHEIYAKGSFGELRMEMRGKPLEGNPKTSALTVLSALRFLHNRAAGLTI